MEPYVPDTSMPRAWLVDMDGTLALGHFGEPGRRRPYDWARVGEDDLNQPVARLVKALDIRGDIIIVMSGRSDACRIETKRWLDVHYLPTRPLLMREDGDYRPDSEVKLDLFNEHVRPFYWVQGAIDDRDSVVDLWRSLGITCFQCAPGDF